MIQPIPSKARSTYKCRERDSTLIPPVRKRRNSESEIVENLRLSELENEKQKQLDEICVLKEKIKKSQVFSIEHIKGTSNANFEFYTGFPNYETFRAFYNFLCPACKRLRYRGSNNSEGESREKSGRKRALSSEKELFLCLSRLRCGLLERDLSNRYDIYVARVSNIWLTWLDFLRNRLRAIPIWPSRGFVSNTMSASFKENYPKLGR